jgi:hypothetical protein
MGMEIHIDISVFCDRTSSYGVVSGILPMQTVPAVGDRVSFLTPINDTGVEATRSFSGDLAVKKITFIPGVPGQVLCDLEDLVLDSEEDACQLVEYLRSGFNLEFDAH